MEQSLIVVLLNNEYVALFTIIALGLAIGSIKVANLSLGSAAVIFVALVFGHFQFTIPSGVGVLGLILFIYCVGISAGPTFFSSFAKQGIVLTKLSILIIGIAAVTAFMLSKLFNIPVELCVGLFAGALTSTPALAAAMDTLGDSASLVSVGYGIAYPFGVVGVVLFVQLLPKLLKKDLKDLEMRESSKKERPIVRHFIEITNDAVVGKSLTELKIFAEIPCQISRVFQRGRFIPIDRSAKIEKNQTFLVVGEEENVNLIADFLGKKSKDIVSAEIERERVNVVLTSKDMIGKTLKSLQLLKNYGVTVTRITRLNKIFVPSGNTRFEVADELTVVGNKMDLNVFMKAAGHRVKAIHETNIFSLSVGIMAGIVIGMTPIGNPEVWSFSLGMSGGLLLVSIVLGHYGRIGKIIGRIPLGAQHLMTELGLVLFLAHAGVRAGGSFVSVASEYGIRLFIVGAIITLVPMVLSCLVAKYVFKIQLFETLGAICGGMTSTPGLGVIKRQTDSEVPIVSYAGAYPVALVSIIIAIQVLIALFNF